MDQPAVGEMPQARDPFVQGVVVLEVPALQVPVPLPAEEIPRKVDPDVLFGAPVAEHHAAAVRAEGVIDQRGGGRPVGRVERHLVQRGQNAVERLPFAHRRAFAWPRLVGPNPIGSGGKNPPLFRMGSSATLHTDVAGAPLPASLTRAWRVRRSRASSYPQYWGDLTELPTASQELAGRRATAAPTCGCFCRQRRASDVPAKDSTSYARRDALPWMLQIGEVGSGLFAGGDPRVLRVAVELVEDARRGRCEWNDPSAGLGVAYVTC